MAVTEVEDVRMRLTISHTVSTDGRNVEQTAKHWMKCGDAVGVADGVVCSVIMIDRGKVRLGFKCPATIKINRTEIYDVNRKKNEASANLPQSD